MKAPAHSDRDMPNIEANDIFELLISWKNKVSICIHDTVSNLVVEMEPYR